jgi:hypothetical protein
MKLIPLTQGEFAQVDDENYDEIMEYKWCVYKGKSTYYAAGHTLRVKGKVKTLYMHRIIMKTPDNLQVDHIDHNGLNNQKSNMRNCTRQQNNCNKKSLGKSKYLGVDYVKGGYIRAQINIDGKRTHLGLFSTEEDAARAYDAAARKHHGEFNNLNFKD